MNAVVYDEHPMLEASRFHPGQCKKPSRRRRRPPVCVRRRLSVCLSLHTPSPPLPLSLPNPPLSYPSNQCSFELQLSCHRLVQRPSKFQLYAPLTLEQHRHGYLFAPIFLLASSVLSRCCGVVCYVQAVVKCMIDKGASHYATKFIIIGTRIPIESIPADIHP